MKKAIRLIVGAFTLATTWDATAGTEADPHRVWIDTDPACGTRRTTDVDDCLAIVQALALRSLRIAGISTVFGNTDVGRATALAREMLQRAGALNRVGEPLPGAASASDFGPTLARSGLIEALEAGPLDILALGPVTNIAAVLQTRPDLAKRIRQIVIVGGKTRPGEVFHPGHNHWVHFRDFNICLGQDAVETVLASGVPLILTPFAAGSRVTVTASDVVRLAASGPLGAWLAKRALGWLSYWRDDIGRDGFSPFDSLAVGYLADPSLFACQKVPAEVRTNWLLGVFPVGLELVADHSVESTRYVTFCHRVAPSFKARMMATLIAASKLSAVGTFEVSGSTGSRR